MSARSLYGVYACFALLFLACKKEEKKQVIEAPVPVTTHLQPGLPADKHQISGYLFASRQINYFQSSVYMLSFYSAFNDPAADLINTFDHVTNRHGFRFNNKAQPGNISLGNIQCNNSYTLQPKIEGGEQVFYFQSMPVLFTAGHQVSWAVTGKGSFKGFTESVARDFPEVGIPKEEVISIRLSQGYTLDPAARGFSNYDSVVVSIEAPRTIIQGRAVAGSLVKLERSDLAGLETGDHANIYFNAFNYSTKTIEGKVHVFELATRVNCKCNFEP